ncbi:MAG: glycoside hydrolase family 15 protein, partial [Firmicutes bacterium]|nr:glycoside hydrolase family 15 protein [Bacillota bacterium]
THSRLMCWVALTQGARMAEWMGDAHAAARWRAEAEAVQATIEATAVDPAGGFYVQAPGTATLDAALLLMPLYGYVPADHPRFRRTLEAIERELVEGVLVYRYRSDMLGRAAHPFLLASSWLARVYLRQGRREEAARVIDGLAAQATDLGLLGEHTDRETGAPRGNFPQAFSHLGLLMAVLEYAAGEGTAGGG